MMILEDKAQKADKHKIKHLYWESIGVQYERVPLPCGDYVLANDKVLDVIARKKKRGIALKKMDFLGTYDRCVDTKFSMLEIIGNICGKDHERFRDECLLCMNNGIKLFVLVENEDDIKCLEDVYFYQNPRKHKVRWKTVNGKRVKDVISAKAVDGNQLYKSLCTIRDRYSVDFVFCQKEETGQKIIEILGGSHD